MDVHLDNLLSMVVMLACLDLFFVLAMHFTSGVGRPMKATGTVNN
jgi:hypothetical protein